MMQYLTAVGSQQHPLSSQPFLSIPRYPAVSMHARMSSCRLNKIWLTAIILLRYITVSS